MKVEKLMTEDPLTCAPEDDLSVPARHMWEADCGCVPVVDRDRHVVGMITDRDVCMAAYTQGRPLRDMRVGKIMSSKVHACRMADDLDVAEQIMKSRQVRRLPVLDSDERLVGMLSLNDLALRVGREVSPGEVASVMAVVCAHRARGVSEEAVLQPASKAEVAARTVASRRSGETAPVRGRR